MIYIVYNNNNYNNMVRLKPEDPTPAGPSPEGICRCLHCHWLWTTRKENFINDPPVACPDCQHRGWRGERE